MNLQVSSHRGLARRSLRYSVWQVGPGSLSVEVRPSGSAILRPSLCITAPGGSVPARRQDEADLTRFTIDAELVERLREASGPGCSPHLILSCDAFASTRIEQRTWGWDLRISRAGCVLPGFRPDGQPLRVGQDGFTRGGLRRFPAQVGMANDYHIICLA
ncbi:MAG TPA: hypothetical protein PKD92_11025 [Novosphingobium sp.]|nr:hypothetical protein [Novosphingobium sp.]